MKFYQVKALVTVFDKHRQNSHILGTSDGFMKSSTELIKSFHIQSKQILS